jgi:hypothetical protein
MRASQQMDEIDGLHLQILFVQHWPVPWIAIVCHDGGTRVQLDVSAAFNLNMKNSVMTRAHAGSTKPDS